MCIFLVWMDVSLLASVSVNASVRARVCPHTPVCVCVYVYIAVSVSCESLHV